MSKVMLKGKKFRELQTKIADLANEGWDISEIIELLHAEGYRRPDGSAFTPVYVASTLWAWKHKDGKYLRPGVRYSPGGQVLWRYKKRRKSRPEAEPLDRWKVAALVSIGLAIMLALKSLV